MSANRSRGPVQQKMTRFEVYWSEKAQAYYWRLVARNSQIIAVGGEGYTRRASAYQAGRIVEMAFNESPEGLHDKKLELGITDIKEGK